MNRFTRRQFLKISAATFGAGATPPAITAAVAAARQAPGPVTTVPTFCEMCFWKCSGIAHVRDGRVWKFVGNPDDPLSRGRLCPRGTSAPGAVYDPDRLRKPLLRVGERGKHKWQAVSWDEALGHVAKRMQKIAAQHGPESIALISHGFGGSFIKQALRGYGCINQVLPSFAQCKGAREVGWTITYGEGLGSPEPLDLDNTNCLVLIGSHLGENMHNTHVQEFADAVARGIPVIVVDPRYSVAASKAKHWLPIKPATDVALVLAWINVIVSENLYDREFVAKHGHKFDEFAAEIRDNTPEWAERETGISAETIRVTAREFASHRPRTIIHPGRRSVWNGDATQRSRAIALLNALMGNWGRRGGIFMPTAMRVPGYPKPDFPKPGRPRVDSPQTGYPFADEFEGVSTSLRQATLSGKPYPVKGWFVYASDPLHVFPNQQETLRALDNLDLLVVIDTVPSDIAAYADVVLPESVFMERHDDLFAGFGRRGWVSLRQPVVKSPHDQKPGWWIAKQLSEKLGTGRFFPWRDIEEYLAARCKKAGLSYAELKKKGVVLGPKTAITVEDGYQLEFGTPSGKVEFYSDQLKAAGFDPVPKYTRHEEAPDGFFRLITGRAPVHTFSRTQSNPYLAALMPENEVWVNTRIAQSLGIEHGKYVKLRNQDGIVSGRVRVKATERLRADCVYMVWGFGHTNPARRHAHGRGANVAQLTTRYQIDPIMGATSIHDNFVAFVKEA